jgi:hypothetical protein
MAGQGAVVSWRRSDVIGQADPASNGRARVDTSLSEHEERIYRVWLHSPSVHALDPTESILAFKIANALSLPGSRVLRALRGVPVPDAGLVERVERFVEEEPTLTFVREGSARRIALVR